MTDIENEETPERDFAAEMRGVIEAAVPDGDFVAAVIALEIVEKLTVNDLDLLTGWLNLHAVSILTDALARRDQSRRSLAQRRQGARRFGVAAKAGDVARLSLFNDVRYVVDEENTRRPLGDMTGADCRFAAAAYHSDGVASFMEEAFLLALGKKAGKRHVRDVMSEAQAQALRDSIVKPAA